MPPTFPIPKDMRYTQHGVYIPSTSWLTYRPSLSLAHCLSHTTAVYSHYTLVYLTNTQLAICGQSALITEALKLNELQTKHRRGTRAVTQHSGLCDVTASYTQEETITHRTLLCNSPQDCNSNLHHQTTRSSSNEESRAKTLGEAATTWRKFTASSERFLYKAPSGTFLRTHRNANYTKKCL